MLHFVAYFPCTSSSHLRARIHKLFPAANRVSVRLL
jgi:hypothetical protein